jgi:hypothetical protein|tara:strand:- start:1070 stop:1693 length:624 start_codon:yes stop_codon:yes gene_type:complete
MKSQSIKIGTTQIRVLSTVKGVVSEAEVVEKEIDSFIPDLIVLGLSEGEVEGIRKWDGEPYELSGWDEIYGLSLRKLLGDNSIRLPPPSFTRAIEIADSKNITIQGLDMDEETYTDEYTKNISTWQLFKRGRLEKSMVKSGIEGSTPEEIAMNMENSIRQLSGFKKLEILRVEHMVSNLRNNFDNEKILAIIEVSNAESLIDLLKES